MPQISVIIPVYNAEKYIEECICSVLAQSFEDWELLLIDDGSKDKSRIICDEYAGKDCRINVIHKPNSGVSDTRNKGLDAAKGDYIITLDADDFWMEETFLEKLLNIACTYDLDIIRGEFSNVDIKGNEIQKSPYIKQRQSYQSQILSSFSFLSNVISGEYFLVLCLIKRTIIENIRFNTHRVFLEDAEFFLRMMQQQLKCMYVPICFYAYRKHDDAITVKEHPQKFFDALDYTRLCFNLAKQENSTPEFRLFLINEGIKNYLFDIKVVSETDRTNKEYNEVIQKYDLYTRRLEVVKNAHQHPIHNKHYLCFLPLKLLIYYYRILFDTKKQLRHIYHQILRK